MREVAQRERDGVGGVDRSQRLRDAQQRLHAPRVPATACFTSFGEYCATSHPALAASAIARPLAWPTDIAVRTFTWKNTRSTATTSGRYSLISNRSSRCSSAKRCGSGELGGVVRTPTATARAPPGTDSTQP